MENLTRLASNYMERKVLIGLCVLLIACVIMPIKELRWVLWAQPADATLISIKPDRRKGDKYDHFKRVAYEFDDNGVARSESDLVTTNWPIPGFDKTGMAPPGITVPIEYLPGGSSSRLKDHDDKAWFWGSGIMAILASLAAACWWKFRDAK